MQHRQMKLYAFVNVYYMPEEESTEKGCDEWTEEEGEGCDEWTEEEGEILIANDSSAETAEDCRDLSASDTKYEDESASVASWMENSTNHNLYLFLRESGLLETEVTGLLVWGSINDVILHCVQTGCRSDALGIWQRKTYRSLKHWCCCCCCESEFPYRERHMDHMESKHQLGFPRNAYWLMPMPHKQDEVKGELGLELEKEAPAPSGSTGTTVTWDGSVTFDHNYNCFLVDAAKLSQMPSSNNGEFCEDTSISDKVRHIQDQLSILRNIFDEKYELLRMSDFILPMSNSFFSMQKLKVDTEIVQCCAQIDNLKQDLSECCLSDYNILSPIGSFIQAAFGIESVNPIASSARQRFEALLHSVTCSDLPSLDLELQSPGKVLIKIKEHGGRFGFAYVGMSWKFNGETCEGARRIVFNGSFQMVASSNWESDYFLTDENVTLNVDGVNANEKETFEWTLQGTIRQDVIDKLYEFEAEFAKVLEGI